MLNFQFKTSFVLILIGSLILKSEPRSGSCCWTEFLIRFRIESGFDQVKGSVSASGSRRTKITNKNGKNKKFLVLKCWMFSLEG